MHARFTSFLCCSFGLLGARTNCFDLHQHRHKRKKKKERKEKKDGKKEGEKRRRKKSITSLFCKSPRALYSLFACHFLRVCVSHLAEEKMHHTWPGSVLSHLSRFGVLQQVGQVVGAHTWANHLGCAKLVQQSLKSSTCVWLASDQLLLKAFLARVVLFASLQTSEQEAHKFNPSFSKRRNKSTTSSTCAFTCCVCF